MQRTQERPDTALAQAQRLSPAASSAALGAIGRCVGTLLGPQRTLKLAYPGVTLLTGDAIAILDRLGDEQPAALILLDACETLHAAHGSGVTTFICLTAELALAIAALHRQVRTSEAHGRI